MSFGYANEPTGGELTMTFTGEELELVMEAFRAAVPTDDPLGERIMLRYLTQRVELQDAEEAKAPKMGFLR